MNNPEILRKISETANFIFYISVLALFFGLVPVLIDKSNGQDYGTWLSGTAGVIPGLPDAATEATLTWINNILVSVAALTTSISLIISSAAAARRSRLEAKAEEMKFKTAQAQYETAQTQREMQLKEIEIMKLELEKERLERRKKK